MARTYQVLLNIYDVQAGNEGMTSFISKVNKIGRDLGLGGVFHGAIQIENLEWSFGWCEHGSGVYAVEAKGNPMYQFRETINLGPTLKTKHEIKAILSRLKAEWQGNLYELLSRNCCHFCEVFCAELGVQPIPAWVNRLASSADATVTFTNEAAAMARQVGTSIHKGANWIKESMGRMVARSNSGGNSAGSSSRPQSSAGGSSLPGSPEPSVGKSLLMRRSSKGVQHANTQDERLLTAAEQMEITRSCSSCNNLSPRHESKAGNSHRMRGLAVQRVASGRAVRDDFPQGSSQTQQSLDCQTQSAGQSVAWWPAPNEQPLSACLSEHTQLSPRLSEPSLACGAMLIRDKQGNTHVSSPLRRSGAHGHTRELAVTVAGCASSSDEDDHADMEVQQLYAKSLTRQTCLDLSADGSEQSARGIGVPTRASMDAHSNSSGRSSSSGSQLHTYSQSRASKPIRTSTGGPGVDRSNSMQHEFHLLHISKDVSGSTADLLNLGQENACSSQLNTTAYPVLATAALPASTGVLGPQSLDLLTGGSWQPAADSNTK